jgi:hypothetical protein
MTRPTYFVVAKRHGIEHAEVYFDELPRAPIRGLVYVVRLDQLPDAERWLRLPVRALYRTYHALAERGTLPPRYEPPSRKPAGNTPAPIGE